MWCSNVWVLYIRSGRQGIVNLKFVSDSVLSKWYTAQSIVTSCVAMQKPQQGIYCIWQGILASSGLLIAREHLFPCPREGLGHPSGSTLICVCNITGAHDDPGRGLGFSGSHYHQIHPFPVLICSPPYPCCHPDPPPPQFPPILRLALLWAEIVHCPLLHRTSSLTKHVKSCDW